MATSVIELTMEYADATTRTVKIGDLAPADINPNIKQAINDLNDPTTRETNYPGFTTGFVSNKGANFVRVQTAKIVTTNRIVIF